MIQEKNYGYETGAVWRNDILKNANRIRGTQKIEDIFFIDEMTKKDGVECVSLETIKKELKRIQDINRTPGQCCILITPNTDIEEAIHPYLWVGLNNNGLIWNADHIDSTYWLATPHSAEIKDLRCLNWHIDDRRRIKYISSPNGNYGLRPVIKLKNRVSLKKLGK